MRTVMPSATAAAFDPELQAKADIKSELHNKLIDLFGEYHKCQLTDQLDAIEIGQVCCKVFSWFILDHSETFDEFMENISNFARAALLEGQDHAIQCQEETRQ